MSKQLYYRLTLSILTILQFGCYKVSIDTQSFASTSQADSSNNYKDIAFASEIVDLGSLPFSIERYVIRLEVTNFSDELKNIRDLSASCGCSSLSIASPQIDSGETVAVSAELDCSSPGQHVSSIYLSTMGSIGRAKTKVVWLVESPVVACKNFVDFGRVSKTQELKESILLKFAAGCDPSCLKLECVPMELSGSRIDGDAIEVILTETGQTASQHGYIRLYYQDFPIGLIRVDWRTETPATITPGAFSLERGDEQPFFVQREGITSIQLSEPIQGIAIKVTSPTSNGCMFFVQVDPSVHFSHDFKKLVVQLNYDNPRERPSEFIEISVDK